MKLPNSSHAFIPEAKLGKCLLSKTHPVGEAKARHFRAIGFDESHAELSKVGLLEMARAANVSRTMETDFGMKYVIEASLATPTGGRVEVRTIWIIETGLENPRLVTAYPI